jgi:hypothetical protein
MTMHMHMTILIVKTLGTRTRVRCSFSDRIFHSKDAMRFMPLLEEIMHAANVIPLGWPLLLPVDIVIRYNR